MRIVGGSAGGRRLKVPAGERTRPTADRVKEALFSILEARLGLDGATVLDLFAGSGALALEALSRGAALAVAVDSAAACARVIRSNAEAVGLSDRLAVWQQSALSAIDRLARSGQRFRLVLVDPPYELDPEPLLRRVAEANVLEDDGWLVLEHSAAREVADAHGRLRRVLRRAYGDTELSCFALD